MHIIPRANAVHVCANIALGKKFVDETYSSMANVVLYMVLECPAQSSASILACLALV